jgi:hypothetical protein
MTPELSKKMFNVFCKVDAYRKDKKNPFFNSSYADINVIIKVLKPILIAEKLYFTQPIINNKVYTIIHDAESEAEYPAKDEREGIEIQSIKPQERGSEITFYRRYGLVSLFGLEAEDDDANQTVSRKPNNTIKPINNPNTFEL